MNWKVPNMWDGGDCWILGGGYSVPKQFNIPEEVVSDVCTGRKFSDAYSDFLKPIHDKHVIGVNNAYLIGSWIDVLFFGDSSWYLLHRNSIAQWPGIKVSCNARFANKKKDRMEGIKFVQKDREHPHGISPNRKYVSWNGNSGSAAISLAVHFGVKRIFLLGFDMHSGPEFEDGKKITHWHGSHGKNPKRLPYQRHLRGFPAIAKDAAAVGVEIFNVSPDSKIPQFPKMSLAEALA